jgi:hypothetical protein
LQRQRRKLLPVPYYLVTFTVPQELRRLIRSQQKLFYALLLRHSAGALLDLGRSHKNVRAQLGVLAVLQTWTRDLRYHPHVHCVAPAGGLSQDGLRWVRAQRADYFLPQTALALRFRTRLKEVLAREHPQLYEQIPRGVWSRPWVADVQTVGGGEPALKYLGAYVARTALSAERIVSDDERGVTFGYRDSAGQERTLSLSGEKFLHRLLQHVLPPGLQRVRAFGWWSAAAKEKFERIRALLNCKAPAPQLCTLRPALSAPPLCPHCRQPMVLLGRVGRAPPERPP